MVSVASAVTGEEMFDVVEGVSCESCHGPAGDYKEPHSAENPPNGYDVGKDHGMVLLEDLNRRANACAQCHYITDPRLICAGHPTGTGSPTGKVFKFVERNAKIKHWQEPIPQAAALAVAFESETRRRGPVPDVKPIAKGPDVVKRKVTRNDTPTPLPQDWKKIEQPLPDFTAAINDSLSIEEKLLILKRHLEHLHSEIARRK